MADTSISNQTQDLLAQVNQKALSSLDDYTKSLDSAKVGTNTSALKKTIAEEDAAIKKIPENAPEPPKLNKDLPSAPTPPDTHPLDVFSQFGPVLAVLGSFAAKGPNHAAIDSATAAMNAKKSGDQEAYENKRKEWQENTQKMLDQNKMELEEYNAAIEESKGNASLANAKLSAIAYKFQDEHMLAMLQAGDIDKAIDLKGKKFDAVMKIQDSFVKQRREEAMSQKGTLPDGVLNLSAERVLNGDPKAVTNSGRSGANFSAIMQRAEEIGKERGMSDKDIADHIKDAEMAWTGTQSEVRAVGTASGKIELAANSVEQAVPLMLDAAKNVNLSQFKDYNSFINYASKHTGDPNIVALDAAIQALKSDYSTLIARNGVRSVETDKKADDLIDSSFAKGQLKAFAEQVEKEANAQRKAIQSSRKEASGSSSGTQSLHEKYGLEK